MTASRASLASVRATTLLLVLIAGCGRSRAVEIEPFFEPDVARVEVQIARAPEGGCDALTWTAPLPAELEPVTLAQGRDGPTPVRNHSA